MTGLCKGPIHNFWEFILFRAFQVTPIVPLSPEAWALSFAKYLELRFYAGSYKRRASVEPCGHSLHKDHYQYFAYANMVASFKLVNAVKYNLKVLTTRSSSLSFAVGGVKTCTPA